MLLKFAPFPAATRLMAQPKNIDDLIASADFLPPSFHLLPKLLLLLEDVEANADALAALIRVDPGLTADILRVCNSAAYGGRGRAESIPEAILYLGFREVQRIVMMVIALPVLKDAQPAYTSTEEELWSHSLACAVSSQLVVKNTGVNPDLAFTAALLHDVGKLVLAKAMPAEYRDVLAVAREQNVPLYNHERRIFKMDHATIGGRLLERWGFPRNICAAVQFHHEPGSAREEPRLAASICLSNVLSYRVQDHFFLPEYVRYPDIRALRELGLNQPELESLAQDAREAFKLSQENFA